MIRKMHFAILATLLFTAHIFSQKKSLEIGIKVMTEFTHPKIYEPGIGLQSVLKLTKHSGVETGLYLKTDANSYFSYDSAFNLGYRQSKEKNLLLPILYRFDSKFLSFTAGPILKYFMSWKDVTKAPPQTITRYNQKTFELMASLSISKNFHLSPSLILEPEVRGSAFVPRGGGGFQLNLSLRKKLF
jgi:hypothetical protein